MRAVARLSVIIMVISLLIGCGNKTGEQARKEEPTQSEQTKGSKNTEISENVPTASSDNINDKGIELSRYYMPRQNEEKDIKENQIIWKKGEITFTAEKTSSAIISMQVTDANHDYKIDIPKDVSENPNELVSIALSANHKYLAIDIYCTNVGNQLIVVDLSSGKSSVLNSEIDTGITFETIQAYNWSPKDNKLAFSYGDTSSSKLAIYDFDRKALDKVSGTETLISTAFILWSKESDSFDFISEYPSDQYKIYRYITDTDHVEELADISSDNLSKYSELEPTRF